MRKPVTETISRLIIGHTIDIDDENYIITGLKFDEKGIKEITLKRIYLL